MLLMTSYLALIYHWSGNRARDALLFPLGGSILVAMLGVALRTCRTGRVNWRDTHFQIPVRAPLNTNSDREAAKPRSDAGASRISG